MVTVPAKLTADDLALLRNPTARAQRAQIAQFLTLYRSHLAGNGVKFPPAVRASIMAFLDAFDQWTTDEAEALKGGGL